MKWNAFELIKPAIQKTKKRLFPFNFKEWFKLSFISSLTGSASGNFNSNGGGGGGDLGSFNSRNSTKNSNFVEAASPLNVQADPFQVLRELIKKYWIVGGVIAFFGFILVSFWSYITSVFNFIFVEELSSKKEAKRDNFIKKFIYLTLFSILILGVLISPYVYNLTLNKNVLDNLGWTYVILSIGLFLALELIILFIYIFLLEINTSFKRNNSKGISLFWFRFIIGLISLIFFISILAPYAYHFMKGNPIISSVGLGYIIFSIFAIIIYSLAFWILLLFLYDFVVPLSYSKNIPAFFSWKLTWKYIGENKKETFMYWLARLLMGLLMAFIMIAAFFLSIIVVGIIGLILFLIGFLIYKLAGGLLILAIIGLFVVLILASIWAIAISLFLLPFNVFLKYLGLLNFEKLTGIKILKF